MTIPKRRVALVFLFVIGTLARFVNLGSIPHGIHPDEAMNGNEGYYAMEHSAPRLYYPANGGREGLFINLVGASVWAFGSNRLGLRFWSALIGSAAIPLIYLVGRELFSRSVGLLSALFLATSFWHVNFSRIGFRAICVPTLLLVAFWGLLVAWRTNRLSAAVAGGIAFGLGFHTYIAFRVAPVVAAAWIGIHWLSPQVKKVPEAFFKITAIWCLAATIVAAPMAFYFLQHPEDFSHRIQQVSVLSKPDTLQVLGTATGKSLLMFSRYGDCNGWHNVPCQPELPRIEAILLAIGVSSVLIGLFRGQLLPVVLPFWLCIMLIPSIFSWEGSPSALRSIGTIPPVFLMAGLGADVALGWLRNVQLRYLLAGLLVASSGHEYYRYFAVWANSPAAFERSKVQLVDIAGFLNRLPREARRYVVMNDFGVLDPQDPGKPEMKVFTPAQVVIYLTRGHPEVRYLQIDDLFHEQFAAGAVIVPMAEDPRIFNLLRERGIQFVEDRHPSFTAARIRP